MGDKHQLASYPLRLDPEVRVQAEEIARQEDRSLNWMLNSLVKLALPIWKAKKAKEVAA